MDLVADIGATNARFQLVRDGSLTGDAVILPTGEFTRDTDLLSAALTRLHAGTPGLPTLERALLAVAGPAAVPGEIQVTNTGLVFNESDSAAALSCDTRLVNDFFALAHGVPHFDRLERIGGEGASIGTKALLGPGSGLGMATILPVANGARWRVLASEGGHADLAPGSHLEAELWGLLMAEQTHVSWETVLCGRGLQRLYAAMCVLWGTPPEDLSPEQISQRGVAMSDPICHQTLETFCALLGSVAGNLALTVTAAGGVYLGGGIIPQILEFVRASPLRRRFEERGAMSDFARAIPILVITEPAPGLVGAAHCLQTSEI